MRKLIRYLASLLAGFSYLLSTTTALAQTSDYFDTIDVGTGAAGLTAGFTLIIWVIICIGAVIGIALLVWTILMIVDVAKRKDYKDQTLWLILLIAGLVLGFAIITTPLYYFLVKRKLEDPSGSQSTE